MLFLVRPNWKKLNRYIWESLENLSSFREDVYVQLLAYRYSLVSKDELERPENVEILNDPIKSKEVFKNLPTPNDEQSCIQILNGYFVVLNQIPTAISSKFHDRLLEWNTEHNLRYSLTEDCQLKLTIGGLLQTQIEFLRSHIQNQDTRDTLLELEECVTDIRSPNDVRNSIRVASNLLEGVACERASVPGHTLGQALDRMSDLFPHKSMDESVRNIYKFFSDYPNLRHQGNPASKIRELKKDDALLTIALIVSLYCLTQIHEYLLVKSAFQTNVTCS